MRMNFQLHAPNALYPGERSSDTLLIMKLGGPQSQPSRRLVSENKILLLMGIGYWLSTWIIVPFPLLVPLCLITKYLPKACFVVRSLKSRFLELVPVISAQYHDQHPWNCCMTHSVSPVMIRRPEREVGPLISISW
jgi:hypothetical protein